MHRLTSCHWLPGKPCRAVSQFPRKQPQVHSINSIGKIPSIIFGGFEFPLPTVKKEYDILIFGDVHIPVEVTSVIRKFSGSMLFGMSLLTRPGQPC